jgi:hypothetical protein
MDVMTTGKEHKKHINMAATAGIFFNIFSYALRTTAALAQSTETCETAENASKHSVSSLLPLSHSCVTIRRTGPLTGTRSRRTSPLPRAAVQYRTLNIKWRYSVSQRIILQTDIIANESLHQGD